MIKVIITLLFLIVGVINFAPLMGVLGQARLESLYAVEVTSPDMLLLLRHRAVLFGIVGGYIIVAAFKPAMRTSATIMGMLSMLGFVVLYPFGTLENTALYRIAIIDIVAIMLLAAAYGLHWFRGRSHQTNTAN